ncbi:hypothetical protein [Burkholderia anthina]|uniref:hypothetical protein n=1 Tax=Burkholderia anthina TaxID=179879 RepID=UPI00158F1F3C
MHAGLGSPRDLAATAMIMATVCVSGYVCHVWIEKPMLAALKRCRKSPRSEPTPT